MAIAPNLDEIMGKSTTCIMEVGLGENIIPSEENEDSNILIDSWLIDKPVYRVCTHI